MRKFAFAAIAMLAISFSGIAGQSAEYKENNMTFSISGKVLDITTGEALAGVKVQIHEAESFTYSDFDGNFLIDGLFPGAYNLSTTYISYETNTLEINVDPSNLENIEVMLDQVKK